MLEPIKKENSHTYGLPMYKVGTEGLEFVEDFWIHLCKGSKGSPAQTGILSEDMIKMILSYLTEVNVGDLRTRETGLAITKLEEALMWLNKRTQDRAERGVLNTYKK